MLTMWPPSRMCGRQSRVIRISPRTFVSMTVASSSSLPSQNGARPSASPALLTRMSRPPSSATARSTKRSQLSRSVTSRSSAKSPPRSSSRSTRLAPTATLAPASASVCATAAPIPLEAPVTTAVLCSSGANPRELRAYFGSGAIRLPHPELVDQHPQASGAVLVVADALREDVDDLRVDERHPWRLIDGLPIDSLPQSAGGVGVRCLLGRGLLDLPVDARVAELRGVRVRRAIG